MLFNGLTRIFILSLYCGVMIIFLVLNGSFPSIGNAQERAIPPTPHQDRKTRVNKVNTARPSFNEVVCHQKHKSHCQSHPLSVEQVEPDKLFKEVTPPYSLLRTSYAQTRTEFFNIEIYVDREHRNFQDEIVEIFDQSLVLQGWQDGAPIEMECYCDDREPLTYSFIVGHTWGKRAGAYLKNLAEHSPRIHVSNYGNQYSACKNNVGECQDVSGFHAAFRFLAIGQSHSGCLIRLKIPSQRQHRRMLLEQHPLFLQQIHVAGVWPR